MSFLQFITNKQNNKLTIHSLQAHLDSFQDTQFVLLCCLKLCTATVLAVKRASFIIFREKRKASMTVEAAFAIPLFLFAMLNILYSVNMINVQSRINAALHQIGNQMAVAAYPYEYTGLDHLPSALAGVALTEGYARNRIIEYVGQKTIQNSCIKNGSAGISLLGSSIMGAEDCIKLQVSYFVVPFSGIVGFDSFILSQKYYGRAWTGYDVENSVSDLCAEDPLVYITKSGQVYHIDRSCAYLNPSVSSVAPGMVDSMRNESGGKYYACDICGKGIGFVYITEHGNRFHSKLDCPGIRRTIYTVPLSEVGGRGRCSKCG